MCCPGTPGYCRGFCFQAMGPGWRSLGSLWLLWPRPAWRLAVTAPDAGLPGCLGQLPYVCPTGRIATASDEGWCPNVSKVAESVAPEAPSGAARLFRSAALSDSVVLLSPQTCLIQFDRCRLSLEPCPSCPAWHGRCEQLCVTSSFLAVFRLVSLRQTMRCGGIFSKEGEFEMTEVIWRLLSQKAPFFELRGLFRVVLSQYCDFLR